MLYGMSYDQYWFGDPWMARAYAQLHLLKRKQLNEEMWVHGIYMVHALNAVVGNMFSKKRVKYIEKPLDLFEKTQAEKQAEIRSERQKLINLLEGMRKKSAKKKQGVEDHGKP